MKEDQVEEAVSLLQGIRKLPYRTKFAYGVGHVLNDLCAGMWFSYLLLYFHKVLLFPNDLAGLVLLIGQIADALCTPFVGIESDRDDGFFLCRYGKRKTWHLVGTLCVLLTFPFLFIRCIGCEDASRQAQIFYYAMFVIIFQFGWASVQISHLSLIPDLTECQHERTELNAIRYGFLVSANICVYVITWLVLGITDSDSGVVSSDGRIGPKNDTEFRNIVFILIGLGTVFSVLFHAFTPERKVAEEKKRLDESSNRSRILMKSTDWLKEPQFYKVALLYMSTRLYVNVTQVYLPMYLQDHVKMGKTSIAIFPLVMYIAGLVASFGMKALNRKVGRKFTYFFGGLAAIAASAWFHFGDGDDFQAWLYVVTVLAGIGASTLLVTSLSITADLIGSNVESGAFVYGAMSFTDKLSNGLAIMAIQHLYPCTEATRDQCGYYYRDVLSYVCGGCAILGVIALFMLIPHTIGDRRKETRLQVNYGTLTDDEGSTSSNSTNEIQ